VNIPQIISLYNEYYMEGRSDSVKNKYLALIAQESRAGRCAKCGTCEGLCPQQLPIRDILSRATMIFEEDN
jgi:predicted aldo/keto reductase-like oxidoreductase